MSAMQQGLSDFISHVKKKGVFRPNRYEISFGIPQQILTGDNIGDDMLTVSISCMSVNIPGFQVYTDEQKYGNFSRKSAYDRTTELLETNFLSTGNMDQRKYFDKWIGLIFKDGHRVEYYDKYISSILITCYDNLDNEIYKVEVTEAYPITITQTNLDRSELDQTSLFQVSWAYHRIMYHSSLLEMKQPILNSPFSGDNISSDMSGPVITAEDVDNEFDRVYGKDAFSAITPITSIPNLLAPVRGPMGDAGITNTVDIIPGNSSGLGINQSSPIKGVVNSVNNVFLQIKNGTTSLTDGLKLVKGYIKDFKTIANMPKHYVDSTVHEINAAVQGVTGEIPGVNKKRYKLPEIKVPTLK